MSVRLLSFWTFPVHATYSKANTGVWKIDQFSPESEVLVGKQVLHGFDSEITSKSLGS
jgi:hypothetical protein